MYTSFCFFLVLQVDQTLTNLQAWQNQGTKNEVPFYSLLDAAAVAAWIKTMLS